MKTATQILADNLASSLRETCCDACGSTGDKSKCCKAKLDQPANKAAPQTEATHPFIKRCVAAMTKGKGSGASVSRAFAVCTASKDKNPEAAAEKEAEGVPKKRMSQYEKALTSAKKARAQAKK